MRIVLDSNIAVAAMNSAGLHRMAPGDPVGLGTGDAVVAEALNRVLAPSPFLEMDGRGGSHCRFVATWAATLSTRPRPSGGPERRQSVDAASVLS